MPGPIQQPGKVEAALASLQKQIDRLTRAKRGVGAPCWFRYDYTGILPASGAWHDAGWTGPFLDGVAAGTDVVIDTGDATHLRCQVAGTYLITASLTYVTPLASVEGYLALNDDSVGPASSLENIVAPDMQFVLPMVPLALAAGDYLRLRLRTRGAAADATSSFGVASLIRLGGP